MIYVIRGQKVMLGSDLAKLYEVDTSALNRQVRRNIERFPDDFMFELSKEDFESLIYQNGISKQGRGGKVNISIMRIFVKLRSHYALEDRVESKVDKLEQNVTQVFKVVFERLDNLEEVVINQKNRKKIGLNNKD